MNPCRHRRSINAIIGRTVKVWNCAERDLCTEQDHGRKLVDGTPMAVCESCPLFSARGAQTYRAIASESSPTNFTWDCNQATLLKIGFYPPSAGCTVTIEPEPEPVREPVGDILHALLDEIGIRRSSCPVCAEWQQRMNRGIKWCTENRAAILGRLNEQAKTASWIEALSAGRKGFWTTAAILDEAIKRAQSIKSAA